MLIQILLIFLSVMKTNEKQVDPAQRFYHVHCQYAGIAGSGAAGCASKCNHVQSNWAIFDPPHEGDNSLCSTMLSSTATQKTANNALRRIGKCQYTSAVQRLNTFLFSFSCSDRVKGTGTINIHNHETGTLVKTIKVSTVPV